MKSVSSCCTKRRYNFIDDCEFVPNKKPKIICNYNEQRKSRKEKKSGTSRRSQSVPASFRYYCPNYMLDPIRESLVYETKIVKLKHSYKESHIQKMATYKLFPEVGWFLHTIDDQPCEEIITLDSTTENDEISRMNSMDEDIQSMNVDYQIHSSFAGITQNFIRDHLIDWQRRWYKKGKLHRSNGPAVLIRTFKRDIYVYFKNGLIHRGSEIETDVEYDQPAHIVTFKNEILTYNVNSTYYWKGKLHRLEGPCMISGIVSEDKYSFQNDHSVYYLFGNKINTKEEFQEKVFEIKNSNTFLLSVVQNEMAHILPYDMLKLIISFC